MSETKPTAYNKAWFPQLKRGPAGAQVVRENILAQLGTLPAEALSRALEAAHKGSSHGSRPFGMRGI
jgi:hypothetical protein